MITCTFGRVGRIPLPWTFYTKIDLESGFLISLFCTQLQRLLHLDFETDYIHTEPFHKDGHASSCVYHRMGLRYMSQGAIQYMDDATIRGARIPTNMMLPSEPLSRFVAIRVQGEPSVLADVTLVAPCNILIPSNAAAARARAMVCAAPGVAGVAGRCAASARRCRARLHS